MMDKKIELERLKSSKKSPVGRSNKKTVAEEARDLGLIYVGNGRYSTRDGVVSHVSEKGRLVTIKE